MHTYEVHFIHKATRVRIIISVSASTDVAAEKAAREILGGLLADPVQAAAFRATWVQRT